MEIHTKGNEERPKKEGKWQNKGGWGSGKWGKIRSKAQIFARINGDDDRCKCRTPLCLTKGGSRQAEGHPTPLLIPVFPVYGPY